MITVHHLNNSRSHRVLWLLEELELAYEIVRYERDPQTLYAPGSLEAIHPLGKSPVLVDRAGPGSAGARSDAPDRGEDHETITLAESGAILEYLVETYGEGRFVPRARTPEHRHYRYFMHYAEGSLGPFLLLRLVFRRIQGAKMPFIAKPIAKKIAARALAGYVDPNLRRHMAFLADHLAHNTWFAGREFTAADIQMSFSLEALSARAHELDPPAKLAEYVDRIRTRPAYQRALARGGEYRLA